MTAGFSLPDIRVVLEPYTLIRENECLKFGPINAAEVNQRQLKERRKKCQD